METLQLLEKTEYEHSLENQIDVLNKEIKQLKSRKRYGLVWESNPEEVVELCKKKLPVLREDKEKEIKTGFQFSNNVIIEGDNYHALSALNYTHAGKIDVIYIDPPYNTGNKTWKYNNHYIEKDDSFRHSKWISFMERRLQLAKKLLTEKGFIAVAIDDYEHHTLRLLMDDIFGENNRLGTIVVVHNPRGRNDDKYFATMHEYMLVYSRNASLSEVGYFDLTDDDINAYNLEDEISNYSLTSFMRTGNNSDRHTRPKLFYPIYYNPQTKTLSLDDDKNSLELLPVNNSGEEKTWRWGKETFLAKKETELVIKKVKDDFRLFKKRRVIDLKGKKPRTVWYDPRYDASSHGIMVLQKMFNRKNVFPYPKSLWANVDILKLLTKKDSVILDFFAGSGTVGHATAILNQEDEGSRKFILCTNNEGGIAEEVCYPRIAKVITGYSGNTGYEANLKYFKTDFVDSEPTDMNKKKLIDKSTEMLCLKEDCFEEIKKENGFTIFKNNAGKHLGIIYDDEGINGFKEELKKLSKEITTYIFSLDESAREDEFEDIKNLVELKPIPVAILNVYKRIFK